MIKWIMLFACLAFLNVAHAEDTKEDADRYVKKHLLPSGQIAVVAEGDLEPRSIGSYSIRIYSNVDKKYPTDDFICGIIQTRDGVVENVTFADINQDKSKELIVIMRCVGASSTLSADAYSFKDNQLVKVATLSDQPKDADCVKALMSQLKKEVKPNANAQAKGRDDAKAKTREK